MTLRMDEKQALVAEVAEVAAKAHSAIAAEYRGMTVEQLTKLRIQARKNGVFVKVVKNTGYQFPQEEPDYPTCDCNQDDRTCNCDHVLRRDPL